MGVMIEKCAKMATLALMMVLAGCTGARLSMQSRAMEPTIPYGSNVEVDLRAYDNEDPLRYDVVLFKYRERPGLGTLPQPDDGAEITYRVIGLPGETVEVREDGIRVNGSPLDLPPGLFYMPAPQSNKVDRFNKMTLPEDGYYLLGDNTNKALDSRYWGAVRRNRILGKVRIPQD